MTFDDDTMCYRSELEAAGLPKDRKSVSMKWDNSDGIKEKFVKPTGDNKKTILITNRLSD